ncbi:MAG TPA: alpha/beta hydrolase [Vicinamibacterales bacterium]|nr:alpha/beta hydrolase [Vicinamibacterales bacterium]
MQVATTPMIAKTIRLGLGLTLEYVERGSRGGLPVVFLHGVTDSWGSFEGILARLPESIHAYAVSQRGHGNSSRPAFGYRIADMARDLTMFLNALEIDRAVLVGHSMGSFVAQRFAIDRPERTAGLALLGSGTGMRGNAVIQDYWAGTISGLTDPVDPAIAREFQLSTLSRPTAPGLVDACVLESLKVPARIWREAFAGFLELDHRGELGRITAPTLIADGDRDDFFTPVHQRELHDAIPGSTLLIYPGGGHAPHWEDPGRVAADLVSFFDTCKEFQS